MPGFIEPMMATLADEAVQRPGLAVRDQVGRLPGPGGRPTTARSRLYTRRGNRRPRPTSRGSCRRRRWIDARPGDRRRRGRRPRRGRRARLQPAPGADQRARAAGRAGVRRARATRRSTSSTSTAARSSSVPLEDRKRLLRSVLQGDAAGSASRRTSRPRASAFYEAAKRLRARGDRRQAPPLARTSPAGARRLAEDQDPARAGARRRRLDARARATRRTSARSPSACTRATGCGSPARSARGSTAGRGRSSASGSRRSRPTSAVRPGARSGRASCAPFVWVRPELVIRAELGGWTRDGYVRQTSFKGLDDGHDPRDVVRERPVPVDGRASARRRRSWPSDGSRGRRRDRRARAGRPAKSDPADAAPSRTAKAPDDLAADGPDGRPWVASASSSTALDAPGSGGPLGRRRRELKLTNLDKVAVPAERRHGRAADHEARADPLLRAGSRRRCCRTSPIGRSTSSASRTAPARPGFWQKDIPSSAPNWLDDLARAGFREREDREANAHLIADRVADAVLARQPGRVRDPRLDLDDPRPVDRRRSR